MIIVTIRTDKPEAELALFDGVRKVDELAWEAHRQLADTIHLRIRELLSRNQYGWGDIEAVVCYEGPGSFTGLRIGLTVGNTITSSLQLPIVTSGGENWQQAGIARLLVGDSDPLALPRYGGQVNITLPKK